MNSRSAAVVRLVAALCLIPVSSQAGLKAYKAGGIRDREPLIGNIDFDGPAFGTSNSTIARNPSLSPTVRPTPGEPDFLKVVLDDPGGGVVSVVEFEIGGDSSQTISIQGFNGPASMLFIRSKTRTTFAKGQTGVGSTTGAIDWGVLTGWSEAGGHYCKSDPPVICTFIQFQEDGTIPSIVQWSSTFDLGTWTFDSTGDFDATGWISHTYDPGAANLLIFLEGKLFGATLPALPIVGYVAIVAGLLLVGGRSLMRRKE